MKKLVLVLFIALAFNALGQKVLRTKEVTDHSIHVIGSNFEGIIFTGSDFSWIGEKDGDTVNKVKIYIASKAEITLTEKVLYSQIKDIDKDHHYRNGLDIFNNWRKYRHQYVFYETSGGEKFVWINCFSTIDDVRWSKEAKDYFGKRLNIPSWYNRLIMAFDGGDAYWRVRINLKTKKIIEFNVNGSPV